MTEREPLTSWIDPSHAQFRAEFSLFDNIRLAGDAWSVDDVCRYILWLCVNQPAHAACMFCTSVFTARAVHDQILHDLGGLSKNLADFSFQEIPHSRKIRFSNKSAVSFLADTQDLISLRGLQISTLAINVKINDIMLDGIERFFISNTRTERILHFS